MFSKEYIQEFRRNFRIAYPVALSQLGHMAVGVADSIMVGALGGEALASVTIAFSISIPFMMLGIGVSYGISPLIAKADGESNQEEISRILKHSIVFNGVMGTLLFTLLYFSSSLLWQLDQPPAVVAMAIPFFELLAVSMIPLMLFQVFRQFAEGLAVTRQAMYITLAGNILNIGLNYLLITGEFGMPALGVSGAAWATLVSRIFMAGAMFAFVYYHSRFRVYWQKIRGIAYSVPMYLKMLKMTLPVGIQLSLESGAFGFAAIMIGWLGADEIAAHHVALNMASISYMAATGIASAATVRVGNEFGKKDFLQLRVAGMSAFTMVVLFMGICALIFVMFRHSLPHLYISEQKIEHIATSLLLITAFFQLSDGIQVVGLGTLRGIGDVKRPTAIALVAYWLVGLPSGYVFAFSYGLGVEGVWYGLFLGLLVASALLFIRFNHKSKRLLSGIPG